MENDLFMSMLPTWQSQDTLPEMNSSSSSDQSPATCFFSPFWDKSPEEPLKFNSITSSPVSPPPSVKAPTNDGSLIREMIGKFENSPKLANFNMGLNSRTPNFSGDPNSGFGSKSFMSQFGLNHGPEFLNGIAELTSLGKRVSRVSSSPSLKASEPPMAAQGNKTLEELQSFPDGSSVLNPEKVNLKKRKSSLRGKVKEVEDELNSKRAKQSENGSVKTEENRGGCSSDNAEEEKQNDTKTPEPLKDYIHVRARRGQATDSHSLAERVRREKISERMKLLQDIVPGCNKVTGKALMLDEIINYVQSLQRQVEFLSMKLASVDSSSSSSNSMGFNAEASIMKDVLFRSEDTAHPMMFPLDSSASTFYSQKNSPLNSSNQTVLPLALDGLNQHLLSYDNFCGDDLHLQTIVNLGFGQTAFDPQSFRGE